MEQTPDYLGSLVGDEVQTRDEYGNLRFFTGDGRVREAFDYADKDPDVWKISFNYDGEIIRLVRDANGNWTKHPMSKIVEYVAMVFQTKIET